MLLVACGGRGPKAPPGPTTPPLHTTPLTDLAPAASLVWLVDVRPRDIASHAELLPAIGELMPPERLRTFAAKNGGVDLLSVEELTVAAYPETVLWLARTPFDPNAVEAAFAARVVRVEGRSLDWADGDPLARIARTWGTAGTDRVQLALLGREAIAVEVGRLGPLRAAELLAEGRLKRASPALKASPLAEAAAQAGEAPLQAFAPGPFTGDLAKGLGGLLGASTAVGASARVVDAGVPGAGGKAEAGALACRIVLLGAWGDDAPAAAERLLAAWTVLAESPLGRLTGIDRPVAPPRAVSERGALVLEVTVDARAVAHGLREATGASVDEIMLSP